jgi:uncharacterized protein YkwD
MIRCYVFLSFVLFGGFANAEPPQAFANRLAASGQLFHDHSVGRENVFYSSNTAFPRLQARAAWRKSPGHRANLPMFGLRVARGASGVYVVGRR